VPCGGMRRDKRSRWGRARGRRWRLARCDSQTASWGTRVARAVGVFIDGVWLIMKCLPAVGNRLPVLVSCRVVGTRSRYTPHTPGPVRRLARPGHPGVRRDQHNTCIPDTPLRQVSTRWRRSRPHDHHLTGPSHWSTAKYGYLAWLSTLRS
jgi:hypothetical protein